MLARRTIERSSISLGVVVVENFQGIFQPVGHEGKVFVPRRVLLDLGAQSLMLGASIMVGLELTKDTLEECPWITSTSIGGMERTTGITKAELSLKLNQEDMEGAGFMKMKAIVTKAKSYDVLVGTMVLYPIGLTLDFWEENSKLQTMMASRRWVQGATASLICLSPYWEPCRFICFLWLRGCRFELIQGKFGW